MGRSDMFLKVTGQRTGEILGESNDRAFANQIDVVDWSWGMNAPTVVGGQRSGRVAMSELQIVKRVDRASTSLMAAMNTNELLKSVVLTVRRAGGANPLPYFVVKLDGARIDAYKVDSELDADGIPVLVERLGFSFKQISVDYTLQTATGGSGAASNFTAQTGPA